MIEFLPLKRITDRYSDEIHRAVLDTVDSGSYIASILAITGNG